MMLYRLLAAEAQYISISHASSIFVLIVKGSHASSTVQMGKQTMGFSSQALNCRADQKLYHLQVCPGYYLQFDIFLGG